GPSPSAARSRSLLRPGPVAVWKSSGTGRSLAVSERRAVVIASARYAPVVRARPTSRVIGTSATVTTGLMTHPHASLRISLFAPLTALALFAACGDPGSSPEAGGSETSVGDGDGDGDGVGDGDGEGDGDGDGEGDGDGDGEGDGD